MAAKEYPRLKAALEVLGVIALAVGGIVGLWRYSDSTANEFQKPLWEREIQLLFETSEVVSALSIYQPDTEEWKKAKWRFWTLYYGPLCIVEDKDVESTMVEFGTALNRLESARVRDEAAAAATQQLRGISLKLAGKCRSAVDNLLQTKRPMFASGKGPTDLTQHTPPGREMKKEGADDSKRPMGAGAGRSDQESEVDSASAREMTMRGGQLYDSLFDVAVINRKMVSTYHPLWRRTSEPEDLSETWRCVSCHGWDYKGVNGYPGVVGTRRTQREMLRLLKSGKDPGGHGYGDLLGLSDRDIDCLASFLSGGIMEVNLKDGHFDGDKKQGYWYYKSGFLSIGLRSQCLQCHEKDGRGKRGTNLAKVASDTPMRFQHRVRFGRPGNSEMPAFFRRDMTSKNISDLGAYVQSIGSE